MVTAFFDQYGNKIAFQNKPDMLRKLSDFNWSIPSRTKGRKSEHREKYCLKKYLTQLCLNDLLKFPLEIEKDESPDFLITNCDNTTTALEVTEATIEDYQRAKTEFKKRPDDSLFTYDRFKNEPLPKGEYKKAILNPGDKMGPGWTEYEAVTEWIICCMTSIRKKVCKINDTHFKYADRYDLLVYDACPFSNGCDIEDAMPSLKEAINNEIGSESSKRIFTCISVVQDKRLFHDVANNISVLMDGGQNFTYHIAKD
jgi:hypothetical protein